MEENEMMAVGPQRGLAARAGGAGMQQNMSNASEPAQASGDNRATMIEMVQKVAALLQQGVTPEQLLEQGVPQEVIEAAIRLLQEQQAQMGQQRNPEAQGLAARSMRG
jgi:hypothetical protein